MSFMDILLKSNSKSVEDILKVSWKEEANEMKRIEFLEALDKGKWSNLSEEEKKDRKQWYLVDRWEGKTRPQSTGYTVQESIIQYVENNKRKWEIESNSKLGRVISTRRLNAIFDKVKKENGITQLDTIDESLFFTEPKRKTDVVPSTERVSASSRKGKQLMQHVLFQVSEVLKESEDENAEEVEIVLALRAFIEPGRQRDKARDYSDLEQELRGRNGLISKLRKGRNVQGNNRYMSRLLLLGLFNDKFLLKLGKAIKDDNQNKAFHPTLWNDLNSGDPTGIDLLRDFLRTRNVAIPNISQMKGFHRQLVSGDILNVSTRISQLIKQKENPDDTIYDFSSENVVNQDIKKIKEHANIIIQRIKPRLDKFKDESGGYTDINHETEIYDRIRGKSNRELAQIDFDEEFGNIVETDIGAIEDLWESLSEIVEVLEFIEQQTNIQINRDEINNIRQERFDLINSISNYMNYVQSHERLKERQEIGRRQLADDAEEAEGEPTSALDNLKNQYTYLKNRLAELPNRGFNKIRTENETNRTNDRINETRENIMEIMKDMEENREIVNAKEKYQEIMSELGDEEE